MRTAKPTAFSNGWTQKRPFSICIAGPNQQLCSVFFRSFRSKLAESTSIDFAIDEEPDLPRPQNYVRVARPGRVPGDGRVIYTLTWDSLILEDISRGAARSHIDAYILVFETTAPEQFSAINSRHMDRVLDMCRTDSWGPNKAIMLAAHHANPFSRQTAYTGDEMRALMRRSHAVFRRGNFTTPAQCAEVVDLLVMFLTNIHSSYDLSSPRPEEQPLLSARTAESSLAAVGDVLVSLYEASLSWQARVFPTCVPTTLTLNGDDPDKPPDWTDEERAIHSPAPGRDYTPMGALVGGYQ